MKKAIIALLIFSGLALPVLFAQASAVLGTIDSTYKYAWSENMGWVNFGADQGNVTVSDSELSGYIWSSSYGWINLNPDQSGVQNNSEGKLSGYAWGEKSGWINFSGVVIDYSGEFSGTATGDSVGDISFDCSNCTVKTDWRHASTRIGGASSPSSAHAQTSQPADEAKDGAKQEEPVKDTQLPEVFVNKVKDYYEPNEDIILSGTVSEPCEIFFYWEKQYGSVKSENNKWIANLGKMALGSRPVAVIAKDLAENYRTVSVDVTVWAPQTKILEPAPKAKSPFSFLTPLIQKIEKIVAPVVKPILKTVPPAKIEVVPASAPVALQGRWRLIKLKL